MADTIAAGNLTIRRGATFHKRWIYADADLVPIDISTWFVKIQARIGAKIVFQSSNQALSGDIGVMALSVDGEIDLDVVPADTSLLNFNVAEFDMVLVDPNAPPDIVKPVLKGNLIIDRLMTVYP